MQVLAGCKPARPNTPSEEYLNAASYVEQQFKFNLISRTVPSCLTGTEESCRESAAAMDPGGKSTNLLDPNSRKDEKKKKVNNRSVLQENE